MFDRTGRSCSRERYASIVRPASVLAAGWLFATLSCHSGERIGSPDPLDQASRETAGREVCAEQRRKAESPASEWGHWRAIRELGVCLGTIRSSEHAASHLQQAVDGFASIHAPEDKAETLLLLGREQIRLSRLGEAERSLMDALTLFETLKRPAGMSEAHLLRGELFQGTGDFEESMAQLKGALQIAEDADLEDQRARALQKIGTLYSLIGFSTEALDYLSQALRIQQRLGAEDDRIETLAAIGWVHYLDFDPQDALPHYDEAMTLAQDLDDQSVIAGLLDRLGSAHRKLGRFEQAESAYRSSLAISRRLERPAWQAHTLSNLGRLMLVQKKPEEALRLLDESLHLMHESGDLNGALVVQLDLARAHRQLDRPTKAWAWLQEALATLETLRGAVAGEASRMQFVSARYEIYEETVDLCFELWKSTGDRGYLLRALETAEQARARGLLEGLGTGSLLNAAGDREEAAALRRIRSEQRRKTAQLEEWIKQRLRRSTSDPGEGQR